MHAEREMPGSGGAFITSRLSIIFEPIRGAARAICVFPLSANKFLYHNLILVSGYDQVNVYFKFLDLSVLRAVCSSSAAPARRSSRHNTRDAVILMDDIAHATCKNLHRVRNSRDMHARARACVRVCARAFLSLTPSL